MRRPVLAAALVARTGEHGLPAVCDVRAQLAGEAAVFARKPWPTQRAMEPDFVAWEAPGRFLVGYGLDVAGTMRGLPFIGALD